MQWLTQAPANIALIKYMGKKDSTLNIPDNPSLSYTLDKLISTVMLETNKGKQDYWEPLNTESQNNSFSLNEFEQARFLKHLSFIKQKFHYDGSFIVRSNNNFPHSSGLASSASSFAALTKCATLALSHLTQTNVPNIAELAQLSQQGSGSSCRSFFSPWCLWQENSTTAIDLPYQNLHHLVIVISKDKKQVSSTQAHQRVKSNPDYQERRQRAITNLTDLIHALKTYNWALAYQICFREFQDMHQLFMNCAQPFSYLSHQSTDVLDLIKKTWDREGDGPLVTMDAGPNIHLLYRRSQIEKANQFKLDNLRNHHVL